MRQKNVDGEGAPAVAKPDLDAKLSEDLTDHEIVSTIFQTSSPRVLLPTILICSQRHFQYSKSFAMDAHEAAVADVFGDFDSDMGDAESSMVDSESCRN